MTLPKPYVLSVDFNALRVALIDVIMLVTNLNQNHVIVSEGETPNEPRPSNPYISMKIIGPAYKYGDDSKDKVAAENSIPNTLWNSGGQRRMDVEFNSYGRTHEEAYNYLSTLQTALDLQDIQQILRQSGIAVWIIGAVTDLSALLNTGFEGRAHMDVQFGIAMNMVSDLGQIDTAVVEGSVTTDQNNVVPVSETVTDQEEF